MSLKHHIIFFNYYSNLNDILEEKIRLVRFSNLALIKSMGNVERILRLRKLEVEEEMEYHEEQFISNFKSDDPDGYKDYSKEEIFKYILYFKEKPSSKIYNHNYKHKNKELNL